MMCGENKELLILLLLGCLLAFVAGALRAEEQWYLISETELQNIERLLEKSEREKASWLSQAQGLRRGAESLETESESLNRQLAQAREQSRRLEQSFNAFEAGLLTQLSSKNGEIVELRREKMELSAESRLRLIVIVALAGLLLLILAYRLYRFIRPKIKL